MATRRSTPTPERIVTLALLGLVAGLGVLAWQQGTSTPDTSPLLASGASAAADTSAADDVSALSVQVRPLAELTQTTRRPLFFADRRAPDRSAAKVAETAAPKAVAKPPSPLEQVQLLGIVRGVNGEPRALVRPAGDGLGVWISVGDVFRGWRVAEISDQNAVFLANGLRGELQLFAPRAQRTQ